MFEEGTTYYIRVRGRVQGPFDLDQLKKLRQRGQFSRAHEVSPDQASWQSASILDAVFVAPKRAAPAKVEPVIEEVTEGVAVGEKVPNPPTHTSSTKPTWHYTVGEEQYGPVTLLELRKLVASGDVLETDLVWKEGMPDWTAVIDLDELKPSRWDSSRASASSDGKTSQSTSKEYAGFWFRFFAFLIDGLILGIGSAVITVMIGIILTLGFGISLIGLADREREATAATLALILSWIVLAFANFMLQWLYFAFMESSGQRATIGKLACGIMVTDESGAPVTFAQATGRFFAKIFITSATLGIGYLMCVWTKQEQCLHDKIASCLVVKR
jgi:uncharacterized RDD family membrane protein YckC